MGEEPVVGALLYSMVLVAYVPWGVWALHTGVVRRNPLVFFCYLGLFSQNAVGSVFVIFPDIVGRQDFYREGFVGLLLLQALLFYMVTTPYLKYTRLDIRPREDRGFAETAFVAFLAACSAIIIWRYVTELGVPPVVKAITGELTGNDLIKYRVQQTYGLEDYSLYHLGITVIPTLVAAIATGMAMVRNSKRWYLLVFVSLCVTALPGGKGSIVDVISIAAVAYVLGRWGYLRGGEGRIAYGRLGVAIVLAFVPIFVMYRVYYSDISIARTFLAMLYRIVGVNSESIAGSMVYVENGGTLNGATLPTVRGLLDHEYINLSREMHFYLFGPGGGAPVSALTEGYVNFGLVGFVFFGIATFVLVIAYEVVLLRYRRDLLGFGLICLYSVFATKVSQASVVATFVSLTYTAFIVFLLVSRDAIGLAIGRILRPSAGVGASGDQ